MKKILRWFLVPLLSFLIVIGAVAFKFSDTLFQEGNPIPILKGIVQLQIGEDLYVPIDQKQNRYIASNNPKEKQPYNEVKRYMGDKGWTFEEKLGNDLIFTKDQNKTVVKTVMYTSDYYIFDVTA
ncbi:hypothetical protein [Pontibacillus yanchengensis]|uniref:Uncharacterized protein n=1 Tax=Pontibacillus yanchengensis Y32 TaxID=1385514 RepID=A0A0A2TT71_9BACI|nr:hypothetical protein [Pontibacillus yanchengensis]KGP72460.1 hypothetical protein N782_05955 [Pontibacillus yanchengensis Y32]